MYEIAPTTMHTRLHGQTIEHRSKPSHRGGPRDAMQDGQAYVANVPVKGPKSIDRPKTMKLHPCTRKEKRPSKQNHALRGENIVASKLLHGSLTSCSTWKHKLAHNDPHCCILLCNSTQALSQFHEYPRVQIVAIIISTFLDGAVQLTTMFFTSPSVSTSRCCGNTTQSTKKKYGCEQSKRIHVNEHHACFAPKTYLSSDGQPRDIEHFASHFYTLFG